MKTYQIECYANYEKNSGQDDYFEELRALDVEKDVVCAYHYTAPKRYHKAIIIPYKIIFKIHVIAETGTAAIFNCIEWREKGLKDISKKS